LNVAKLSVVEPTFDVIWNEFVPLGLAVIDPHVTSLVPALIVVQVNVPLSVDVPELFILEQFIAPVFKLLDVKLLLTCTFPVPPSKKISVFPINPLPFLVLLLWIEKYHKEAKNAVSFILLL